MAVEQLNLAARVPVIVFFSITGIFTLVSACGGPGERIKEIEAVKATESPTPGEREISGTYNVTGAGANDAGPYSGLLTIAPKGDNYEFRWTTNRGSRVGTGVQIGNTTAVSYSATGGGKGCGVVLYRIASDGSLDGRVAIWNEDKFATINASRTEGRGFVGKYSISGKSGDGVGFAGRMNIIKDGAGYDLEWVEDYETEPTKTIVAFGIWKGSYAAASFGGRQCGFALYDIQSNGNLEGNWGGQKQVTFGTETAKRQ